MSQNKTLPRWLDWHHQVTVVDIHAHPALKAALFQRALMRRDRRVWPFFWPLNVRTSIPALQAGGVDVLLSATYAPEKPLIADIPLLKILRWLPFSYVRRMWRLLVKPSYAEVTAWLLDELERRLEQGGQHAVKLARSLDELETILALGKAPIAFVHTIEGGHSLQGKAGTEQEIIANLENFFARGVAALTLVHFYPNLLGMPVFPYPAYALPLLPERRLQHLMDTIDLTQGLTPLGRSVVQHMTELGMLIDVSHCTPAARRDVYQIVEQRGSDSLVMATHVGVYALNPIPYNLEDWEIRWIANHGGVVGVIFMNYWLVPYQTGLGLDAVAATIDHLVRVTGGSTEHIAIGSDFDGFTDPPDDLKDASELPRLTERLLAGFASPGHRKYTPDDLENILGRNALRMLREGWGRRSSM